MQTLRELIVFARRDSILVKRGFVSAAILYAKLARASLYVLHALITHLPLRVDAAVIEGTTGTRHLRVHHVSKCVNHATVRYPIIVLIVIQPRKFIVEVVLVVKASIGCLQLKLVKFATPVALLVKILQ